jgi:hypothetical protein
MQPAEQQHVDVVLRYFDGCNTGELDDLLPTLAEDVIHYFLPERASRRSAALTTWRDSGASTSERWTPPGALTRSLAPATLS